MDQDSYRSFHYNNTQSKVYFANRPRYSEYSPKSTRAIHPKQVSHPKVQSKVPPSRCYPPGIMNQLAPRFQQRALYSQYYRTDYESSSWRVNLLAASYRARSSHRKPLMKGVNLGLRPDPEGAPSFKSEDRDSKKKEDEDEENYDHILDQDVSLYSDYGSDTSDLDPTDYDPPGKRDPDQETQPNSSWSTASLLTHAFNQASSNKVTVMSFAVIGAELNSITKLHTSKTESDLSRLTKKTQKLTENIDNARKSLKDIALGLRALKQEVKQRSKRSVTNREKLLRHPSSSQPSDLSHLGEDTDRHLSKRRSTGLLDKLQTVPHDSSHLTNYCTIDRRHKSRKSSTLQGYSDPRYSMIKYMNLDIDNKQSSSDEY